MKIYNFLVERGLEKSLGTFGAQAVTFLGILVVAFLGYALIKKLILHILKAILTKGKSRWGKVLYNHRVFERLLFILPVLVIHLLAPAVPAAQIWIQRIAFCVMIFSLVRALDKLYDAIDDIYRQYEISKSRPIKGYLQVLKIVTYIVGGIIIVSVLLNRSPLILLGGIGAATAVLMLIFQNTILGFVASIQLTENDMLRLGDWIEMEKHGANGAVTEITLHTVKVKNWDKTITTVPTHTLVSESFKNWRGMQEDGGRRLVRPMYIDMTSIQFCDDEMLERYGKIQYIQDYLDQKEQELEEYNATHNIDPASPVNGRRLTNVGTFRAYVVAYLNRHPGIHKEMSIMVRQHAPTPQGLPLEIYAFTNTIIWNEYESIASDIFDHLLAVLPQFNLRVYQSPSGHDMSMIGSINHKAD